MTDEHTSFFIKDLDGNTIGVMSVQIFDEDTNFDVFIHELRKKYNFYQLVERGPLEMGDTDTPVNI